MKKVKKKSKIVLFKPHVFSGSRPYYGAPLDLLSISRILDKEGYEIKIITPVTYENHIQSAIEEAENAICFGITSLTGYSIYDGLKAAKEVREAYPNLPLVWGGWHPSILPIETAQDDSVDIVVKGQGERTFTDLVHSLEGKKSLENISGIVYKNEEGKIINNPDRPLECLDNFPAIPYHLVDVEKFIVSQEYGKRSLNYYTSYGCPHRCLFCVEQVVNKRKWVGLSPEKAAEELADMKAKYSIDSVAIVDSNFFVGKDRAKRFSQTLLNKRVDIKWGNVNGRTKQLSQYSDETWKLMKESGLSCILIGAESGDDETLNYMKKDITVQNTINLTKICAKYDIKILSSFLVGFPKAEDTIMIYESVEKEIKSAFNLMERMFEIYKRIRMMFAIYLPYPSTGLFDVSKRLGLKIPENFEEWNEYLIAAEDATKMKVRQKWIHPSQARKVLMASIYIFFFLDPDSFDLVTSKIKSKLLKLFLFIGFQIFKAIALFRWRLKFFRLPVDFYFYNFLRKYSKLG